MSSPPAGRRRRIAVLLATGLTFGAGALAAPPALADPTVPAPPTAADRGTASEPVKAPAAGPAARGASKDKLGEHDRELLGEARSKGQKSVTALVATQPGQAGSAEGSLKALGGTVGYRNDKVGYVRAQLPVGAVEKAAAAGSVLAIDLNEKIQLPDPDPAAAGKGAAAQAAPAGPGPGTPDSNPYLPTNETGAVAFKRANPTYDGRGITIGIMDSGVNLDHPALTTTSTGERKIVDWVTSTDPLVDGDRTWRPMLTTVTGPTFTFQGRTYTAPAGTYRINQFSESITQGSEPGGDVNRDGDTTDVFGVLYNPANNDIWVDANQDNNFTNDQLMRPYRERFQVNHFGTDNPSTPIREQMPFVVEFREDVSLAPAGVPGTADFVNIGIEEDSHGSHVAGIAAGNNLFGGRMDGAAPGAKLVSSRACTWGGGCTAVALTEGMIDLVVNRRVDVVNMSIGGLPALNDGNNARAELYNRLIDTFGVQMFISAGNSGPGINTVGDPSVASRVVSVGSAISKATWLANYGAVVSADRYLHNFSSRGPREDGGFKPNVTAPGSAISATATWLPGGPVPEAGYSLPPGYSMFNGTSMASPQAAGSAALLLSGARARDRGVTPAQLRQAMYTSADYNRILPAFAQGMGHVDTVGAWDLLRRDNLAPQEFTISAPVCTAISDFLATPDRGTGIYNRCSAAEGGHAPGQSRTYDVTVTRTSGPAGTRRYALSWLGNDGTFRGPSSVDLPRGVARTIRVTARPSEGAHGAILRMDDTRTPGLDGQMMATVVASASLTAPSYSTSRSGTVERNRTTSYFVTVPPGADALQVNLGGIAAGSQTRFIAFNPYGVPVESTSSLACFTNFSDRRTCNPNVRAYTKPLPGVWEIEVESRRTTPSLRNPYQLDMTLQGVRVDPATVELASVPRGQATPVNFTVTNQLGPVTVRPKGGPLGSARVARPTIADGATTEYTVEVPAGATRMDAAIGNPSDLGADLDLEVYRGGALVGIAADGDSEEAVSIANPPPGTYTVRVVGYEVPAGTTQYDYRDVFFAPSLGSLSVPSATLRLASGQTARVTGSVTANAAPTAGRQLFGEMQVVTVDALFGEIAVLERANVIIRSVTG